MAWYGYVIMVLAAGAVCLAVWLIATGRVSKDDVLYIVRQVLATIKVVEAEIGAGSGAEKKALALTDLRGLADEAVLSPLIDTLVLLCNTLGIFTHK